ncbi:MAG: branched-chain amino acid ABC transporter permease [Candidatus Caldarchaeum sp.]|jgi:branched-chain amino acid transport system permease protein
MVAPTFFIESLVDGIVLGGIYAVIALGLSMMYGVAGVLNIAHGDLVMLAGLLAFSLTTFFDQPVTGFVLAPALIIPLFFLIGLGLFSGLLRPISTRAPQNLLLSSILITLGISFIMQDLAATFLGTLPRSIYMGFQPLKIGDISIPFFRVVTFGLVLTITIVFWIFLRQTFLGRAMRAVTYNREASAFLGVPIDRVGAISFGLGTILAALGGLIYMGNGFPMTPFIGLSLTVKALTVIVVGGAGKLGGALVGGLVLGIAETLTGVFISFYWSPALAIILLLTILMIKPTGIMGD